MTPPRRDIEVGDIVSYYNLYAVVAAELGECLLLRVNKHGHEFMCISNDASIILITNIFRTPHGTSPHTNK